MVAVGERPVGGRPIRFFGLTCAFRFVNGKMID
jgi:hypothetical protein